MLRALCASLGLGSEAVVPADASSGAGIFDALKSVAKQVRLELRHGAQDASDAGTAK